MAIASKQILAGIHDPSKVHGCVDALLQSHKGAEGWGLQAGQGWSTWMGAMSAIGLLFVVFWTWLVLIDLKDLQNAFTPVTFLVTMLCLAVGISQYLNAAQTASAQF
ncbi:hypothetical protein TSTA_057640 [Talaromyces stipitatus ATCC 10500]|uniref:Uncharacterized protein n=1 Tax=Talaromyces stipitatus (strain ATCC 10500 / CBS 375.48 / QM 6759 / NRRL 1006) TaxID=441959 RepID=B8MRU0_TALSN|nr:uncharacterized protein TSTA_057640 [Talaromyces stipitatus ATCC 10500]EED13274.1 hypothetical protein TSTA_057640 [Talaromyces stipitatus ATCC 10500]